ncbi:hypothetical protein [Saccharothrix texasensis]|nr:hypothetical protein [Saccharothrix texasensis]
MADTLSVVGPGIGVAPLLALRTLRFDSGTPRVLSGVVVVSIGSLR